MFNQQKVDCVPMGRCKIKIGIGSYEIDAVIHLYKYELKSEHYDFAEIQFMSGNTVFLDKNKKSRIHISYEECLIQGPIIMETCKQTMEINELVFKIPSSNAPGSINLSCSLSNKSGGCKKHLYYTLAEWVNERVLCVKNDQSSDPLRNSVEIPRSNNKNIIIETVLTKDAGKKQYNCATIYFTDKDTDTPLKYCKRLGSCCSTEPIYLFNINLIDRDIDVYSEHGSDEATSPIMSIEKVELITANEDRNGKVILTYDLGKSITLISWKVDQEIGTDIQFKDKGYIWNTEVDK